MDGFRKDGEYTYITRRVDRVIEKDAVGFLLSCRKFRYASQELFFDRDGGGPDPADRETVRGF